MISLILGMTKGLVYLLVIQANPLHGFQFFDRLPTLLKFLVINKTRAAF
jgi:hypothetical protein